MAKKTKKTKKAKRRVPKGKSRSARSGRYVSKRAAERNPSTTVTERG